VSALAVSVIIPAYNHGRYIAATLDSVLAQSFADWEAVVVDDGSTDDTAAVVQRYAPRIRYVSQPNAGVAAARNHGLRVTTAPYVVFQDADDLWPTRKLELQTRVLDQDPDLGMVYGAVCRFHDGTMDGCSRPRHRGLILEPILRRAVQLGTGAVLIRRAVLERVGPFDTSFSTSADYDLWLRIAAVYRVDFVDEPVLHYRIGQNAMHRDLALIGDPVRVLDKFFGQGAGREPAARRLRSNAYARTYFAIAGEAAHRGRSGVALSYLTRSIRADARFAIGRLAATPLRWLRRRSGALR
jgi:glycosyltransferase involved in cell wall biosynthesis